MTTSGNEAPNSSQRRPRDFFSFSHQLTLLSGFFNSIPRWISRGYAHLLSQVPVSVAVAFLFMLLDCGSIVLSHFEKSSPFYTLAIFSLSEIVAICSLVSFARKNRGSPDERAITGLEVAFSSINWVIATYNLVRVFKKSNNFYKIDYFQSIICSFYCFFYTARKDCCRRNASPSSTSLQRRPISNEVSNQPTVTESQADNSGVPSSTNTEAGGVESVTNTSAGTTQNDPISMNTHETAAV